MRIGAHHTVDHGENADVFGMLTQAIESCGPRRELHSICQAEAEHVTQSPRRRNHIRAKA